MTSPSGNLSRRTFLAGLSAAPLLAKPQRSVVFLLDGFGMSYFDRAVVPNMGRWASEGIFQACEAMMPTVTNTNNASVCCGTWPAEHGITGNSYFDEATGREEFMEAGAMLLRPTLFQRASAKGVRSALLSCKKKTVSLLPKGADVVLTAEAPDGDWEARYGKAPGIYSREINYWILKVAIDLLEKRPELGCLYVHTTDYPMHTWAPDAPESREHLSRLDALLAEARAAAPDAAFVITADHDMNTKTRCWDLEKACAARGLMLRAGISAERDKYLKHHRGFGGTGWVYLKSPADRARAETTLRGLDGVVDVLSREEAARRYRTLPARIGELAVIGDRETVFGHLESEAMETMPAGFRTHGSPSEIPVPVLLHSAQGAPRRDRLRYNKDATAWLY